MAEAGPQHAQSSARPLLRYGVLLLLVLAGAVGIAWAGTAPLVQHVTPSGLKYQMLKEGKGEHPGPAALVAVHYTGRLADGKIFDSSVGAPQPAQFRLDQVIPGWAEGLQLMRPGGKARFVIPARLAYGAQGAGGVVPPNADLTFDVDLIAVAPPR